MPMAGGPCYNTTGNVIRAMESTGEYADAWWAENGRRWFALKLFNVSPKYETMCT
jgi:hypothetical protein